MDYFKKSFLIGSLILIGGSIIGFVLQNAQFMVLTSIGGFMSIPLFLIIFSRKKPQVRTDTWYD